MAAKKFLGVDLGAESGRVLLGTFDGERLTIEEAHRFRNEPVRLHETLCWDLPRILFEVERGIVAAAAKAGGQIDGVGCDSWGVDFGLLDRAGAVLSHPVHYRDARTEGMVEKVLRRIPRESIYAETGVQFLALNTLFQIAALLEHTPELLRAAGKLLFFGDLVHYLLSGRAVSEESLASTSQMWNPVARDWSGPIVTSLGLPREILPEVVRSGTVLAPLRSVTAKAAGLREAPPVIAPASHDTACAIAAVPARPGEDWAYLSSGTWSLFGVELAAPRITPESLAASFTNEAGVSGTTRFLRNINGLWLVQECRRRWARDGRDMDYAQLTAFAEAAGSSRCHILPGDPSFFAPDDMPEAIRSFCRRTGQAEPATPGEVVRCALESLALAYREAADQVRAVSGRSIERLHVVGGGSKNQLLNQLTADALGVPVTAGPVEATGVGNILIQAMAIGAVRDLAELREVVRRSTQTAELEPERAGEWAEKRAAYRRITESV